MTFAIKPERMTALANRFRNMRFIYELNTDGTYRAVKCVWEPNFLQGQKGYLQRHEADWVNDCLIPRGLLANIDPDNPFTHGDGSWMYFAARGLEEVLTAINMGEPGVSHA